MRKILAAKYGFPSQVTPAFKDIVRKLLMVNSVQRLVGPTDWRFAIRSLHLFTLELNFSTFGTRSWVKLASWRS
jgi:hypothetical protein